MNALLLASLGAGLIAAPAAQARAWPMAQAQAPLTTLSSPGPGVICDHSTSSCYDRNGISLPLTRQHLGSWAEWRLARQLAGRPLAPEFQLSDGSLCDLRSQTCWSDGYGRSQVARELSEGLFGPVHGEREVARFEGLCNLVNGSRPVYDGPCSLRRVANAERGVTRYVVHQPDGSRYTFSDRSGRLEVSDGERSWPATFVDHGYTGLFRWRDVTLVATRDHGALPLDRPQSEGVAQLFRDR
ncbi:MAG: YcgJ family protein [Prochlorococcaceae cyanobacterium]